MQPHRENETDLLKRTDEKETFSQTSHDLKKDAQKE